MANQPARRARKRKRRPREELDLIEQQHGTAAAFVWARIDRDTRRLLREASPSSTEGVVWRRASAGRRRRYAGPAMTREHDSWQGLLARLPKGRALLQEFYASPEITPGGAVTRWRT